MPTRAQRIGQIGRVAMAAAVAGGGLWVIHRQRAMEAKAEYTWSVDLDGDGGCEVVVAYARADSEDGRLVEALDSRTGKRTWKHLMPPGDPTAAAHLVGDEVVFPWVTDGQQVEVRLDAGTGAAGGEAR